ncbi:MAG: hypothetical protein M3065_10510 [Actinomycetota bacterium]|nr:hypothetical protein [Actinomycetota bacterium]
MFERFTEEARQVVVLAQDTARELKHHYIGTEHLLLGLLRQEEGIAAQVLATLDVTLERVRAQVVEIVGAGEELAGTQIPFTSRAKRVLELSLREALSLGHNYIGPEHVLLGIARENDGVASRILLAFDADAEKIRSEVMGLVPDPGPQPAVAIPGQESGFARQVVQVAQLEARELKHNYLGTEHLLLGLLRHGEGLAARVLSSLDVTLEGVRAQVVRIVGVGEEDTPGQLSLTPRAKKVMELAVREALSLGHNYMGTEHILLGIARENSGVASRVLLDFEVDAEKIRNAVIEMIRSPSAQAGVPTPAHLSGFERWWIHVGLATSLRKLLMVAAARALDDGRDRINASDVLLALTRDEKIGPLLGGLGVDEAAVREAIERSSAPEEPPGDAAEG